jgi:4-aminobutyrate aminotransferase-like enzyme
LATGTQLPLVKTRIPGPKSRALSRKLHAVESQNVTFISETWPIFWEKAQGANVWDADGNRYIDLTAAFGVASVGHANPKVVAAIQKQSKKLLHAMGDVHPNELKMQLARELSSLTFERWKAGRAKTIFCNSGAEAVEAALKTAKIFTKRRGIIAFRGAYHGLTYGALDTTWRAHFREKFSDQLGHFTAHVPYGEPIRVENPREFGAVLVEPIQGRGGNIVPPDDFLPSLRRFCDENGMLLIADEIYTGFCRTGKWFCVEHSKVVPDVICLGKALSGGLPISACVARAEVMDAWPKSDGEAIHTSTFLGNPLACAAALAAISEAKRMKLDARAAKLGEKFLKNLRKIAKNCDVRGKGLMIGVEFSDAERVQKLVVELLQRGIVALPEGDDGNVLSFTPPLVISERQLDFCVETLAALLQR